MQVARRTVAVRMPADVVYERLARFEEVPEYLRHITGVRRTSPGGLRFEGRIGKGRSGAWEARVTEAVPGRTLAWAAVDPRGETVRFELEPQEPGATRITLSIARGDEHDLDHRLPTEGLRRLRDMLEGPATTGESAAADDDRGDPPVPPAPMRPGAAPPGTAMMAGGAVDADDPAAP